MVVNVSIYIFDKRGGSDIEAEQIKCVSDNRGKIRRGGELIRTQKILIIVGNTNLCK